jgi:chromosome segregation ATPase
MEHEQKQLHQIINQLRQARKSNKEDTDGLTADRDELKKAVEFLTSENATIKQSLFERTQSSEVLSRRLQETSISYQAALRDAAKAQEENQLLLRRINDLETACSQLDKHLFDSNAKRAELEADIGVVKQDLVFRETELVNLRFAIDGIEKEAARRIDLGRLEAAESIKSEQNKYENLLHSLELKHEELESSIYRQLTEAKQRENDEAILRRKGELEWAIERKRLQDAVSAAMLRLQNSSEDVVDRTVVANLFVSYFKNSK